MTKSSLNASLLRDPGHFLALGFGSGLASHAPGTFGTVAGVLVYLGLSHFSLAVYLSVTILLFIISIPVCSRTARHLGVHDHPAIVIDEIVGYLVTMILVEPTLANLIAGFLLFRLFDIWKPWPINFLDRQVSGGFGIMLDDLIAAGFAILGLEIIKYLSYT